jgi:hypothetical protein
MDIRLAARTRQPLAVKSNIIVIAVTIVTAG